MRCTDQWASVGVHGARHVAYGKDVFCSVWNRTWGVLGDKSPHGSGGYTMACSLSLFEMVRRFRTLNALLCTVQCCNSIYVAACNECVLIVGYLNVLLLLLYQKTRRAADQPPLSETVFTRIGPLHILDNDFVSLNVFTLLVCYSIRAHVVAWRAVVLSCTFYVTVCLYPCAKTWQIEANLCAEGSLDCNSHLNLPRANHCCIFVSTTCQMDSKSLTSSYIR